MVLCHNVVMTLQTLKMVLRCRILSLRAKREIIFEYQKFLICKKGKSVLLSLETQITHTTRFISSDRMSFSLQLFYLCKLLPKNFLKTYYSRIIMQNRKSYFFHFTLTRNILKHFFIQKKVCKSMICVFSRLGFQIFFP